MMTYNDYEKRALDSFKSYKGIPQEYINEIVKRGCIRASYEEECAVTELLGTDQLEPSGFAYECHMLYPDYPDSYEEYKAKKKQSGFNFNFQKI